MRSTKKTFNSYKDKIVISETVVNNPGYPHEIIFDLPVVEDQLINKDYKILNKKGLPKQKNFLQTVSSDKITVSFRVKIIVDY